MSLVNKILNKIIGEYKSLIFFFISSYPDSTLGKFIRKKYWINRLNRCGNNPDFHANSSIGYPEKIEIGDNFMISNNAHITAIGSKGIYIGDNVGIGRGSYLHAAFHKTKKTDVPMRLQGVESEDIEYKGNNFSIIIEDDVLIGSNVVILSGSKIGKGCLISPGSVVSGIIPPYSILAGNPARVSKNRKNDENNE